MFKTKSATELDSLKTLFDLVFPEMPMSVKDLKAFRKGMIRGYAELKRLPSVTVSDSELKALRNVMEIHFPDDAFSDNDILWRFFNFKIGYTQFLQREKSGVN